MQIVNDDGMSLADLLDTISTVASDVSVDSLPMLEKPLQTVIASDNGMTDDEFIKMLPVRERKRARCGGRSGVGPACSRLTARAD
jgi:hypothetical protein